MRLIIHATNVTGLGASQVVISLLEAMDQISAPFDTITCLVPESGAVADFRSKSGRLKIETYRRRLPKLISRVAEALFPNICLPRGDAYLILGDIPLRVRAKQVVFIHQPHLVTPCVNKWVSRSLSFRVMRTLTRLNSKSVDRVIVQTEAMAEGIYRSYPWWEARKCISVIGQPPPSWFTLSGDDLRRVNVESGLNLFYPAASYPHKNHAVFEGLFDKDVTGLVSQLTLTVEQSFFSDAPKWLRCVGRLDQEACLSEYREADALIFPSVLESYGLPLVEAMKLGLPIIAADLPYARVLCGDQAVYFDPESASGLLAAIGELRERMQEGWRPNWSEQIASMPSNWNEVAELFLRECDRRD